MPWVVFITAGLLLALSGAAAAAEEPDRAGASPWDMHAHLPRGDEFPTAKKELRLMEAAGIRWLRTGFVWAAIEPRDDDWHFEKTDQVVAWATEHNVRLMPLKDLR